MNVYVNIYPNRAGSLGQDASPYNYLMCVGLNARALSSGNEYSQFLQAARHVYEPLLKKKY